MSKQKKESAPTFFAKWVAKGTGQVSLYVAGKPEQLKTENGVYKFTEDDMEPGRYEFLKDALKKVGFADVTKNKGRKHKRVDLKYRYTLIHPEHAPKSPVNRKLGFQMYDASGKPIYDKDGKPETRIIMIRNGKYETEHVSEYQSLLKAGMTELKKEQIKTGDGK
jgi:hypothetical protein